MKSFLAQPNATDYYWTLKLPDHCNDYACVVDSNVLSANIRDQVRLLPLCMTGAGSTQENASAFIRYQYQDPGCQFNSNTSALVFSIAHHISADDENYTMPEYRPHRSPTAKIQLKNPRKTYSVTVGRLSWATTDLAAQYGAKCAPGSDYNGLYFPSSNDKQHLILSESQVPRPSQLLSTFTTNQWDVLAIQTSESTKQQGIIYPSNYKFTADSDEWTRLSGGNCSYMLAPYINDVVQNHLYSEDSVQPAYTATMFWLFQNAALRDVVPVAGSFSFSLVSENGAQKLSARVAIPLASAFITCAGVGLVLLLGLFSTFSIPNQAALLGENRSVA